MFKSNLYFLKNINNFFFKKINLFFIKDKLFYKKQIFQIINIFYKNKFLKIKKINIDSFEKKNFLLTIGYIFLNIFLFSFLLEIILFTISIF